MISRGAYLSIYGMYLFNEHLFDEMVLPTAEDGSPAFNKDDFTDNLVMELAEMECLYADPDFMQKAIGKWSKKELRVWQDMYDSTMFEYNPIWNKDSKITETHNLHGTDYKTGTDSQTYGKKDTTTYGKKDTTTYGKKEESEADQNTTTEYGRTDTTTYGKVETDGKGTTNTHNVASYNEASPHVASTDVGSGQDTITMSGTDSISSSGEDENTFHGESSVQQSGSDSVEASGSDSSQASGTDSFTHGMKTDTSDTGTIIREEQGNIGITATTDLIKGYRDISVFNIQDFIIKSFKQRFCLMTY